MVRRRSIPRHRLPPSRKVGGDDVACCRPIRRIEAEDPGLQMAIFREQIALKLGAPRREFEAIEQCPDTLQRRQDVERQVPPPRFNETVPVQAEDPDGGLGTSAR